MEEKKRTIVMFGEFPDRLFTQWKNLKGIDAQFINSGVAGDTSRRDGMQDWLMTYFHINQISLSCKVVQMIPDVIVSRSKSFSGTIDQTCTKDSAAIARYKRFILNLCIRHIPKGLD